MSKNKKVAELLNIIADILEFQGVQFKPMAYRRAAMTVEGLSKDIASYHDAKELDKIPGVGKSIALKIKEFLDTGKIQYLEKLKKKIPKDIEKILAVEGVGPKKAKKLYQKLKIHSIKDLEKAAKKGKVASMSGFGKKSAENILEGIKFQKSKTGRMLISEATPAAKQIVASIKKNCRVSKIEIAGSLRRYQETIGDVDILVSSKNPASVIDTFTSFKNVTKVIAKGPKKAAVMLDKHLHVDLRLIPANEWGSALQYFTGSKRHSIEVRKIAIKKGYKLSEYGLSKGKKNISSTEKAIYSALGMQYIPPEMRTNTGEIELALKKKIPALIGFNDVKGDLHVHTTASDGANTIAEMAKAAKTLGRKFICISDHTGGLRIARGMNDRQLLAHAKAIKKTRISGISILSGCEVNIKADSKLDISDEVLKRLDCVTASIHSGFKGNVTKRIISAMSNDNVDIIGHPTGRLISKRSGYNLDFEKVCDAAHDHDVALEINSQPDRMDLHDDYIRTAVSHKVKFAINTDAHHIDQLSFMDYGIGMARRGGLRKADVINTYKLSKLKRYLR